VNADPNYGSAWFHCRQQPYDVPSTVLHTALSKITHEVAATQGAYARAMLHYIRRCLLGRAGSVVGKNSVGNSANSGGAVNGGVNVDSAVNAILSSPTRSASAPPGRTKQSSATHTTTAANTNTSSVDVSKSQDGLRAHTTSPHQLTAMGGRRSPLREALHTTSQEEEEPVEVRAAREAELLQQLSDVNTTMLRLNSITLTTNATTPTPAATAVAVMPTSAGNTLIANTTPPTTSDTHHWSCLNTAHIIPFVSLSDHGVYCCTDFITGLVEMNRLMYNSNMSDELRRKNLFGSDQIIS